MPRPGQMPAWLRRLPAGRGRGSAQLSAAGPGLRPPSQAREAPGMAPAQAAVSSALPACSPASHSQLSVSLSQLQATRSLQRSAGPSLQGEPAALQLLESPDAESTWVGMSEQEGWRGRTDSLQGTHLSGH